MTATSDVLELAGELRRVAELAERLGGDSLHGSPLGLPTRERLRWIAPGMVAIAGELEALAAIADSLTPAELVELARRQGVELEQGPAAA